MGAHYIGDTAVEALDHAVGLRGSGLDQAMLDLVVGTHPIEGMGAGRLALAGGAEAVGKRFAIVGEELADVEGSFLDQAREETTGGGGSLVLEDLT